MKIIDQSEIRNLKSKIASDVVIIGGGVAGLSAALWCDELGLSALVLEENAETGGQLLWVHNEIKNHLGREAGNGRELRDAFLEQLEKRRFGLLLRANISAVDLLRKKEIALNDGTTFSARAVIIATGVRRRRLNVAGEDRFREHGIIESGKKDAGAAAGKRVLIVGGGDAALENALILSETAEQVFLSHRRAEFRARKEFTEPVRNHPKIELLTETAVDRLEGGERLERVRLKNLSTGERQILEIDALLIRVGVEPNTGLFRGQIRLDENGYVETDRDCATSAAGVFAVGDVANPLAPTVSSAAGTGATAAKVIFSFLNHS